jgi:small subunit ribosomal protein S1
VDFGAFAQLEPGVEGLIHISELADISVADPLHSVRPGERVMVKVLRVDGKRQRIGLQRRMVDQSALGDQAGAALEQSSGPEIEVEADAQGVDGFDADTQTGDDMIDVAVMETPADAPSAMDADITDAVGDDSAPDAAPDAVPDAGADDEDALSS